MIYVPCDNPRVLEAHERSRLAGSVQWREQGQTDWDERVGINVCEDVPVSDIWADFIRKGAEFRLVFPDAEAAGKSLVDYRDRLGADLRFTSPSGRELPSVGVINGRALAEGRYRIAAPAAPEEAPSGPIAKMDPASFTHVRPALPDGVEPVGWSPRFGCWVLLRCDVPVGWEFTYSDAADTDWIRAVSDNPSKTYVLARPVSEPAAPKTERVPALEALRHGWTATHPDAPFKVCSIGAVRNKTGLVVLDEEGYFCQSVADDGTVEVLVRDGES